MSTDDHLRPPSEQPPQPPGGAYAEWLRTRAALTKRALARKIGGSAGWLVDIERGHKGRTEDYRPANPSLRILNSIATATGASPGERRKLLHLWGYAPGAETATELDAEQATHPGSALDQIGEGDLARVLARYPKERWPHIIGQALGIEIRVHGGNDADHHVDPGRSRDPDVDGADAGAIDGSAGRP